MSWHTFHAFGLSFLIDLHGQGVLGNTTVFFTGSEDDVACVDHLSLVVFFMCGFAASSIVVALARRGDR